MESAPRGTKLEKVQRFAIRLATELRGLGYEDIRELNMKETKPGECRERQQVV